MSMALIEDDRIIARHPPEQVRGDVGKAMAHAIEHMKPGDRVSIERAPVKPWGPEWMLTYTYTSEFAKTKPWHKRLALRLSR